MIFSYNTDILMLRSLFRSYILNSRASLFYFIIFILNLRSQLSVPLSRNHIIFDLSVCPFATHFVYCCRAPCFLPKTPRASPDHNRTVGCRNRSALSQHHFVYCYRAPCFLPKTLGQSQTIKGLSFVVIGLPFRNTLRVLLSGGVFSAEKHSGNPRP